MPLMIFDLLLLILDIANVDRDMALARHVTLVHLARTTVAQGLADIDIGRFPSVHVGQA